MKIVKIVFFIDLNIFIVSNIIILFKNQVLASGYFLRLM